MHRDRLKFSIFCLVIFSIIVIPINKPVFAYYSDNNIMYSFYTSNICRNIENTNIIKNGNSCIVKCDSVHANQVKQKLENISGESITINMPTNKQIELISNYLQNKTIKTEVVDGIEIIYGYDATKLMYVMVDGQKTNIQVAINKNNITIGYPLILGSF